MTWDRRLYFPSEGRRAEDFFARKIQWLQPGLNPRSSVPKASTLPLDHRSRYAEWYMQGNSGGKVIFVGGDTRSMVIVWKGFIWTCVYFWLITLFESPHWILLYVYLWGWIKSKVYKRKVDTWDKLLACILDAAVCKKNRDRLRWSMRDLLTSCKVHWDWWWDLLTFILNFKSVI
jgi:hypothetical protein